MMSITPSTAKASACPRDPADNTTAVYVSECCSSGEDPGHFFQRGEGANNIIFRKFKHIWKNALSW